MNKLVIAIGLLVAVIGAGCLQLTDTGKQLMTGPSCFICHDSPPQTGAHQLHLNYGVDCAMCHPGTGVNGSTPPLINHPDGTIDVTPLAPITLKVQGSYDPLTNSCSDIYCHGGFSGGTHASIPWKDTVIACGFCHTNPPQDMSHVSHRQAQCTVCHPAVLNSTPSKTHQNGSMDVVFADSSMHQSLKGATFADNTCMAVSCHGAGKRDTLGVTWRNGTVTWGTVLSCNDCHNVMNHQVGSSLLNAGCYACHTPYFHTDSTRMIGRCVVCHGFPPSTVSHTSHVSVEGYDCNVCHRGYSAKGFTVDSSTHFNGVVNVNGPLAGGSYKSPDSTCSKVYCHGNFPGGLNPVLKWDQSTVSCNTCHAQPPATGAHLRHGKTSRYSVNYDCSVCHAGYKGDSVAVRATHHDSIVEVNGKLGGGTFSSTAKTCSAVYCHGSFTGGSYATPNWTITVISCGSCHGEPPSTGQHRTHMARSNIDCNACHAGYLYKTSPSVSLGHHINNKVEVDGALGGGSYSNGTCSNNSCHGAHSWTGGD